MLDSNTILDITRHLSYPEYSHAVLTQNWKGWSCGVPVIYPSNVNIDPDGIIVRVATLFTPYKNAAGIESYEIYSHILQRVNIKPLCGNHKIMTVSEFDPSKFKRLSEFIHDVGIISFVVDHKAGRSNIAKGIRAIESMFKYTSVSQHHEICVPILAGNNDKYVCIMTFFDLPYCVPLFNMHKVDGVGLNLVGATVKASKAMGRLNKVFRTDIILSNYLENIFVLDGVAINKAQPISSNMFAAIENMTNLELEIGPDKLPDLKKESKPISSPKHKLSSDPSWDFEEALGFASEPEIPTQQIGGSSDSTVDQVASTYSSISWSDSSSG